MEKFKSISNAELKYFTWTVTKKTIAIFLTIIAFNSCKEPKEVDQSKTNYSIPSHPWFDVTKIESGVWRISDHGEDNIYLVEGKDSALLIDSGIGAVNLVALLKQLTKLPIIVVNTHGHPDHVGSNNQFNRAYAHPDEIEMIQYFTAPETHQTMLQYMVHIAINDSLKFTDTLTSVLHPVAEGHVFDLGGKRIEVIHTPGHTQGSICLLDREDKLLFTGDHVKKEAWLHTDEALPLTVYLSSLRKLDVRKKEFIKLLSGHDDPLDVEFLSEQITCAESIISLSCKGEPFESVVGNGLVCEFRRAKIAFDPKKIQNN